MRRIAGLLALALATALRGPARQARAPRTALRAVEGTKLEAKEVANKKAERRRIASSPTFFRTHGDFKDEHVVVQEKMLSEMKSDLLDSMKADTYETTRGEGDAAVTFRLAQEYGMSVARVLWSFPGYGSSARVGGRRVAFAWSKPRPIRSARGRAA